MTSSKEIIFYAELSDDGLHRNAMELAALGRSLADQLGGSSAAILIAGKDGETKIKIMDIVELIDSLLE